MKKLSILFVSILTLGLTAVSCSSDDDKNDGSIEGKWELTQVGTILANEEILQPYTNDGCDKDIVEFKADGKFVDSYSQYENNKCNPYTKNGTWAQEGKTLTKKYDSNDSDKFEISQLSGNKLKLKQTYSDSGITVTAVAVYTKI